MSEPLSINSFLGEAHSVDPKLLPATVGTATVAMRPGKGDLRPWRNPTLAQSGVPTSPQRISMYLMTSGYWFTWTTVVNAVKGFDANDTTERFYFTGSGTPKWTNNILGLGGGPPYPQATRELSVPAPTSTMTTGVAAVGTGEVAEWSYVQTFVNDIGWESAPGPNSMTVSAAVDSTITVGNLDLAPSGSYGITLTRIYRSETGADGSAAFFFLGEYGAGTTSITDASLGSLGDQLATGALGVGGSWTPPPADGHSLVVMWNGMLAMASGKSVYVCEPYTPYAYPLRYRIDVADNVIGLGVYGQNLVILTDGDVYVAVGSDPASLDCQPQRIYQPCLSARSIVSFEDCVVWSTTGGLYVFGDSKRGLLTQGVIDPEDGWPAYQPNAIMGSRHKHLRLYFCVPTAGTNIAFCIDIDEPSGIYSFNQGSMDGMHRAYNGQLYYIDGANIWLWDSDITYPLASFTSKPFQMPSPMSYSACEVIASAYPVHVTVWGTNERGTVTLLDRDVPSQVPVRMKAGKFDQFQVKVDTTTTVQAVRLGQDEDDLRNG